MDDSFTCYPCLGPRYYDHISCRILQVLGMHYDRYISLSQVVYIAHDLTLDEWEVVSRAIARLALRYSLDIAVRDRGGIRKSYLWSVHSLFTPTSDQEYWLTRGSIMTLDAAKWCKSINSGNREPKPVEQCPQCGAQITANGRRTLYGVSSQGSPRLDQLERSSTNHYGVEVSQVHS